jgi:hypothetical protein
MADSLQEKNLIHRGRIQESPPSGQQTKCLSFFSAISAAFLRALCDEALPPS